MPVQPSDFFHLSQSEQDLIQDHINEPVRFQGMLILASLIDCILFGIVLTEFSCTKRPFLFSLSASLLQPFLTSLFSAYWRWFKDGLKFKGASSSPLWDRRERNELASVAPLFPPSRPPNVFVLQTNLLSSPPNPRSYISPNSFVRSCMRPVYPQSVSTTSSIEWKVRRGRTSELNVSPQGCFLLVSPSYPSVVQED